MPGWEVHERVYELLGVSSPTCSSVDELADVSPPRVRDLRIEVGEFEEAYERVPVHFGFRPTEFPLTYAYVAEKYGRGGVACLLTHFILDKIENDVLKSFDDEMIEESVEALLEGYARNRGGVCSGFSEILDDLRLRLGENFSVIANYAREWVREKKLLVDILANALAEHLSRVLRLNLTLKRL